MLGCNEGIKLCLSDGEVLSTTQKDADRIKSVCEEESDLGFSNGSFDSSSDGNLESSLLGDSLESELGPELGSFDGNLEENEDFNLDGSLLGNSLGCTDGLVLDCKEGIN